MNPVITSSAGNDSHHGYLHEPMQGIDRDTEAGFLDRGLKALSGVVPVGYRAPWWELNWDSPALLAERGFHYDSSLLDGDAPYRFVIEPGSSETLVEIPVEWALDDWEQYAFHPGWTGSGVIESPAKAGEMWLLEAQARHAQGGCFVLTNHPFLSGRPSRAVALERLIEQVKSLPGMWVTTLADIAARASPDGRRTSCRARTASHTTISANIDAGQPWRRSYGDNVVYTDWRRDNYLHAITTVLQRAGVTSGRLGVEDDHLPGLLRAQLTDALPGFAFLDVSQSVMRHRMVKSAEEIDLITHGARIADLGGAAVVEAIGDGVPEYEVGIAGSNAMIREIAATFPDAELRDTWVWFQSGVNTDGAHNWATSRRVQRGDILSLNCFPMIAGYYTALERTLFWGHPGTSTCACGTSTCACTAGDSN